MWQRDEHLKRWGEQWEAGFHFVLMMLGQMARVWVPSLSLASYVRLGNSQSLGAEVSTLVKL